VREDRGSASESKGVSGLNAEQTSDHYNGTLKTACEIATHRTMRLPAEECGLNCLIGKLWGVPIMASNGLNLKPST
jgi:hypothetical protein